MNFEALDGSKLIILMLAGAAFAGVGLYMLLKPRSENAAKIELFGLKFESSSAGLLVFIIGAAFLAVPLFAPEKAASSGGVFTTPPSSGPGTKPPALRLPTDADVAEQEPNDRAQGANIVAFGQTVSGDVKGDESDWFVIPLPPDPPREISLMVRHVAGGAVGVELFNANEFKLKSMSVNAGAKYLISDVEGNGQFFARVRFDYGDRALYELRLSAPPGN